MRVVIAGCGRVGRRVALLLSQAGEDVSVVDSRPEAMDALGKSFDGAFAAELESPGRYGARGPVVRVTGEWRHRDEGRGGEPYLAGTTVELIDGERRFDEPMPWAVLIAGLALLGVAASIALSSRARRDASPV